MRQVLPRIRVVVLLSDPVSRAYADFQHRQSVGDEGRSFMQSVADDIRSNVHQAQLGSALQPKAAPMLGYVSQGYYGLQLELLQKLYPRNKVLVMESAALLQDPRAAYERVFDFLGLESDGVDVETPSLVDRDQESIDPAAAAMLREHYRPYDELLSEVCGQQFSWMGSRVVQAA
jgi:hypothetical protein